MKKYLIKLCPLIVYMVIVTLIELTGACIVDGKFYLRDPRQLLSILLFTSTILYLIKNQKARFITTVVLIAVFGIFNVMFIMMYEMTGQHFDFSMFALRNDAVGVFESIPLNFGFTFSFFICLSLFISFGYKGIVKLNSEQYKSTLNTATKVFIGAALIVLSITCSSLTAHSLNSSDDPYTEMVDGKNGNNYNQFGITANFVNELYQGLFYTNIVKLEDSSIETFIYEKVNTQSEYFGISKNNNVVTILGETLEWFAFISDLNRYPNGLDLTDEELRTLFPNFYYLYDNSVVLNNNYAKEKTDVSEMYTMLGSYPKSKYINYDYSDAVIPHSLGNILAEIENVQYKNSFHNGIYTFYNRNNIHKNLGFNEYYASEYLEEHYPDKFHNYGFSNDKNLDSELFNAGKDLMFTQDERFYSYILSITMHGMFTKRGNLEKLGYYDKLLEVGIDIDARLNQNDYALYSFVASALDFDAALGIMFDDLRNKNLLDTTTIVVFSDHNAYYQGLSSYVKGIENIKNESYMELYRVPAMIFDTKLVKSIEDNNESRIINKFTYPGDIIPTLFDILGINYFTNLYFGNNIFSDTESLVYSRSYDIFFNDKIYFKNINQIQFYNKDIENIEEYKFDYIYPKALELVNKIRYTDQIFEYNYFNNYTYYNNFNNKMKDINK